MSEVVLPPAGPNAPASAGALLREARERQGVHIAVLAAAIKVSPRKLDALEADRYDELPDATFTRALAQTVCRALKIDPQPVMALLPSASALPLDAVADGINQPFRERGSPAGLSGRMPRAPLLWAAAALLLAAVLVVYWPLWPAGDAAPVADAGASSPPALPGGAALPPVGVTTELPQGAGRPASDSLPGGAASAPAPGAAPAPPTVAAPAPALQPVPAPAPAPAVAASPLPPLPVPMASGASLTVSEPVWVEIVDASGQVVFQRTVQPGENLTFDQKPPLRLRLGNAAAARLSFRGETLDLAPYTRANVARVELK
jgi:cytoskeleton protein RodZ